MPDPIPPMGSPGQQPILATSPGAPPAASGQAERADNGAAGSATRAAEEAVRLELQRLKVAEAKRDAPKAPSLEDAARALREHIKQIPSDLVFRKDADTGIVIFKLVNPITQEVIREFPPEEIVEMARRLREFAPKSDQTGILLDRNL